MQYTSISSQLLQQTLKGAGSRVPKHFQKFPTPTTNFSVEYRVEYDSSALPSQIKGGEKQSLKREKEDKEYHQSLGPVLVLPRGWSGGGAVKQRQ